MIHILDTHFSPYTDSRFTHSQVSQPTHHPTGVFREIETTFSFLKKRRTETCFFENCAKETYKETQY